MTILMTEPGIGQEPLTVARIIKSRVAGMCNPCLEDKGCNICRNVANGLANGTLTYDSAGEIYRRRIGTEKVTHQGTDTITKDAGEKKIKIEGLEELKVDSARERMIARMTGREAGAGVMEKSPEERAKSMLNDAVDRGIAHYIANRNNAMTSDANAARERMIATMKHDSRTLKPMVISDPVKNLDNVSIDARARMIARMSAK